VGVPHSTLESKPLPELARGLSVADPEQITVQLKDINSQKRDVLQAKFVNINSRERLLVNLPSSDHYEGQGKDCF
jgi:uncharacterized membrane protein